MNRRRWITGVAPRLNGYVTNRTFPQLRAVFAAAQSLSGTVPFPSPPLYVDGFHSADSSRGAFRAFFTKGDSELAGSFFNSFHCFSIGTRVNVCSLLFLHLIFTWFNLFLALDLIRRQSAMDTESISPSAEAFQLEMHQISMKCSLMKAQIVVNELHIVNVAQDGT